MKKILYSLIFFLLAVNIFAQWKQHESISAMSNVPSIFVDGNNVYAGADSIIYLSSDYGKNWTASSRIAEDVDFVSAITKYQNKIFAGTYNYGVFVSGDNGKSWSQINNGLNGLGATTISDLIVRGDSLYAGTYGSGIFVMNLRNPVQWNHYSEGLSFYYSYNVFSLKLIGNTIYAGAGGNGFFYKNDGSSPVWNEISFGTFQSEPLVMYDIIKVNSEYFIVSSYGLHKSKDEINWDYLNTNTGSIGNANFAVHNQKIYVHLSKGAGRTFWFASSNNGKSWDFIEDQKGIEVLNVAVIDNKLFAGRLDGLWLLDLTTSAEDENLVQDFKLMQNYPNPFNPVTTIKYTIPNVETKHASSLPVTLKVYDLLGKEIATLVYEFKQPGNYSVQFSANDFNLSSGVYFYTLTGKGFSQTKKLIFLK
jgi:hypothetical protein